TTAKAHRKTAPAQAQGGGRPMSPKDKAGLHAAVFRNTAKDPAWVGYWLARHQQTEDLEEEQLADKLGVPMDNLVLLCLCRTPRTRVGISGSVSAPRSRSRAASNTASAAPSRSISRTCRTFAPAPSSVGCVSAATIFHCKRRSAG